MVREARFLPPASMSPDLVWTVEPVDEHPEDEERPVGSLDHLFRDMADSDWLEARDS